MNYNTDFVTGKRFLWAVRSARSAAAVMRQRSRSAGGARVTGRSNFIYFYSSYSSVMSVIHPMNFLCEAAYLLGTGFLIEN
ncbi:hypothetical protein [Pseudoduganella flava]|uniref:Uncharacterized protein n=1 Tax=Pseudoduganella flava TaxID=871742 RepID=A0ABX6FXR0_9BURK|nr:hypothetical protein [Pseudoduganella flava]QGZ42298.1 hypothetical protein GO485_26835 [Pseudoduganella flava]